MDTQNLILNAEKIANQKAILQVKEEAEEEKQVAAKAITEYKYSVKLLVRKIKQMKKILSAFELERAEYSKEFIQLNDYLFQVKSEY